MIERFFSVKKHSGLIFTVIVLTGDHRPIGKQFRDIDMQISAECAYHLSGVPESTDAIRINALETIHKHHGWYFRWKRVPQIDIIMPRQVKF